MAAVSAPQAPSALTPPSSSHGEQNSWSYSVPAQSDAASPKAGDPKRASLSLTNGHGLGHAASRTDLSQRRFDPPNSSRSAETGHLAPARVNGLNRKDSSLSERGSQADNLPDLYGPNRSGINSLDYVGGKAGRAEPPLPIPLQHLERDTPMRRTQGGALAADEESISYPKTRGRSQSVKAQEVAVVTPTPAKRILSENSPTKKAPGRKGSVVTNRVASGQRPKTRTGSAQLSSAARPQTRSGDFGPSNSTSKRPEGDPPWLATMFTPDPRLPPDQQLLPTVARRLRQEQWEKEGKFGNTYDTDFRPLNDEQYPRSPEPHPKFPEAPAPAADDEAEAHAEAEKKPEPGSEAEWPLRGPKTPALSTGRPGTAGTGSYSTMPRIPTGGTGANMDAGTLSSPKPPIRMQEPPEDSKKGGCGCCVIM
ncbi:hypothetical protein BUE80_DR004686 [Diplocarpon rosae]|nr:hypothetical protein BUE80_DR004686 [Diplocarpon rosae]